MATRARPRPRSRRTRATARITTARRPIWTIDFIDHDKLASVAMKLLRSGANDGAVVNFFRANVEALTNIDEDRRQRRLKEIPGIVSSARARGLDADPARAPEPPDAGCSEPPPDCAPPIGDPMAPKRIRVTMGSSVKPRPIAWLWPDWLAHGKLHLLAGRPGSLKTTTAMVLAAAVTVGGQWPDGSRARPGTVVIRSGEDAIDDTLVAARHRRGRRPRAGRGSSAASRKTAGAGFDPARDMDGSLPSAPILGGEPRRD